MRTLLIAVAVASSFVDRPAAAVELPSDFDLHGLAVSKNELVCLALNDYWESRGEPLIGRVAVAQVVLNRARDRKYPMNLCDVVRQSEPGRFSGCQFSWNCDGRPDHPEDQQAWRESLLLAMAMVSRDSAVIDPTNGAKWYHSVRIKPSWAEKLKVSRVINGHVFYREAKPARERRQPYNFADWAAERRRYQQVAQY